MLESGSGEDVGSFTTHPQPVPHLLLWKPFYQKYFIDQISNRLGLLQLADNIKY
jgi:hypothetical protein